MEAYKQENRPLVYLDESGFAHSMPRSHGYSIRGQRCYGEHDWGAKGRTNVIGALLAGTLLTVSLFQTTINTDIFTCWVEQDLMPKLPPQSVLILDNATFHKSETMKHNLEKQGHTLLYLPPYSPDLNLIEHKWAQAKAGRRKTNLDLNTLFQTLNL